MVLPQVLFFLFEKLELTFSQRPFASFSVLVSRPDLLSIVYRVLLTAFSRSTPVCMKVQYLGGEEYVWEWDVDDSARDSI